MIEPKLDDALNFRPLQDRVIVKPDYPETDSSLLWLPRETKRAGGTGTVLALGPGLRRKISAGGGVFPMPDVRPGDRVIFNEYMGRDIKIAGEDCVIMRGDDIMCVIDEDYEE